METSVSSRSYDSMKVTFQICISKDCFRNSLLISNNMVTQFSDKLPSLNMLVYSICVLKTKAKMKRDPTLFEREYAKRMESNILHKEQQSVIPSSETKLSISAELNIRKFNIFDYLLDK